MSPLALALALLAAPSPEELVKEGNRLLADADFDGAIARYGEAQKDRRNSPEIDLDLGLAHYRKGELDRAAEYFAAAASKGGGGRASSARFNLGNVRARQGRLEDAVDAYKAALDADPSNDAARHNLEIVMRHMERLKELEKERERAEEEFKKRIEELLKELRELVERQAEAVARTWASDPESAGALPGSEDRKRLKTLAEERKPLPDDLASRLARGLVRSRGIEAGPAAAEELERTERSLSERARKAAETAAVLAADLRKAAGQASAGAGQDEKPPENPLVGKLERAGGAAEKAGAALEKAADALGGGGGAAFRRAEPRGALGLWRLVEALGELASPHEAGVPSEELKALLERAAEIRARQARIVLDLWASFPDSRGPLPSPEEQKAFWGKVRAGAPPTEEERFPLARLEIAGLGWSGEKSPASELAARQSGLAHEARELATEAEALAAKAGGAGPFAGVVGMLRSAAEAMDRAAGSLEGMFAKRATAEEAAVLAFVRLSRAPDRLQELMMRLGRFLAAQMERLLDTWESDPASRGPEPTEDDLESLAGSAKAPGGEAALAPELEAKLGRAVPGEIERRARGRAGKGRTGDEAAGLQSELAPRAGGGLRPQEARCRGPSRRDEPRLAHARGRGGGRRRRGRADGGGCPRAPALLRRGRAPAGARGRVPHEGALAPRFGGVRPDGRAGRRAGSAQEAQGGRAGRGGAEGRRGARRARGVRGARRGGRRGGTRGR
jgi:tetratricopeptide (TPR) repeat protein